MERTPAFDAGRKRIYPRARFSGFAKWHLGIDDEHDEQTKQRYKFPYGDFKKVHRCAVISAESRAGQYKHFDIEKAAARLHELIDAARPGERRRAHTAHG
jgi:hypothetical protein